MDPHNVRPPGTGFTLVLLWLGVGGISSYWLTFFSLLPAAEWDPCYVVFERAFPGADLVLTITTITAAESLRRRHTAFVPWAIFTAGQFCFLGLLGATYNLQHGGYDLTPGMLAELWVNLFCLIAAAWLSTFSWRHRRALGA